MNKVLISVFDQLTLCFKAFIPQRQRSKVLSSLIEQEVQKRGKQFYNCTLAVEKDQSLHCEMKDSDITLQDWLEDES